MVACGSTELLQRIGSYENTTTANRTSSHWCGSEPQTGTIALNTSSKGRLLLIHPRHSHSGEMLQGAAYMEALKTPSGIWRQSLVNVVESGPVPNYAFERTVMPSARARVRLPQPLPPPARLKCLRPAAQRER